MPVDLNSLVSARSFPVYASAARTSTPNDQEFADLPSRMAGLVLVIDATAVTSTPSLTVSILGVDRVSGKTWTILASTAIATVSTTILRVHPNATVSANATAKDQLPPLIRITAVHGNANSITYSIAGHLTL